MDLEELKKTFVDYYSYRTLGAKYASNMFMQNNQQRSTQGDTFSSGVYSTGGKTIMKNLFSNPPQKTSIVEPKKDENKETSSGGFFSTFTSFFN